MHARHTPSISLPTLCRRSADVTNAQLARNRRRTGGQSAYRPRSPVLDSRWQTRWRSSSAAMSFFQAERHLRGRVGAVFFRDSTNGHG